MARPPVVRKNRFLINRCTNLYENKKLNPCLTYARPDMIRAEVGGLVFGQDKFYAMYAKQRELKAVNYLNT